MTRRLRVFVVVALGGIASAGCGLVAGLSEYQAAPVANDGSDGGAIACDASTNGPLVLESSVTPLHLAVQASTGDFYWTQVPSPASTTGSVMRAPACGRGADTFIADASFPSTDIGLDKVPSTVGSIAVDGSYVYWASGTTIFRASVQAGSAPEPYIHQTTATNAWIEALAVVGTRLCWILQTQNSSLAVYSVDTGSPPFTQATVLNANLNETPQFLALAASSDGHLFGATDQSIFVSGHPDQPDSLTKLVDGNGIESLGTLGSVAYWGDQAGSIYSLDANYTANGPRLLESGQFQVLGISASLGYLWWTVGQGLGSTPPGGVVTAALDGGGVQIAVPGQNTPSEVQVTTQSIFWLDRGDVNLANGAVVRAGF